MLHLSRHAVVSPGRGHEAGGVAGRRDEDGGQGGQGRHPALQRGELQPGPIHPFTRLSAESDIILVFFTSDVTLQL